MTFAQFDSGKKPLEDLLKAARNGTLQLPDFQRGWVWDDYGIRSLIASISQSFPVGALMALQTGGEVSFKPRLIEGVDPAAAAQSPEFLLLDGQQRITSLYQACYQDKVIVTSNAQRREIRRWYYIDMKLALDPEADREEAIVGVPETRTVTRDFGREVLLDLSTPEKEYTACMFPLNCVFDERKWEEGFEDFWDSREYRHFYRQFRDTVVEAFRKYQVPVITLGRETLKEAVCLVFEKVNTGGKKLDAFELLTAIYAADNFNLRDDWYGDPQRADLSGRLKRLSRYDVLRELQSVDFLQACTLLHTFERRRQGEAEGRGGKELTPISCTRQAVLDLPLTAYRRWAEPVTCAFETVARLLTLEKVFRQKDVPYKTQLVPLAAILAHIGGAWERQAVREKLARWYWCGVFGELYGSAIESRFAKDLPEVVTWLDAGPEPSTVQEASFAPDRLYTLRSRLSAAYKGLHALLMRHGARDFRSGQPFEITTYFDENVDIHHIFPKAWCQRRGIDRGRMDSIVNKTPLSSSTNRLIGGEAPSRYLPRVARNAGIEEVRIDELVASHLGNAAALRADDFEGFYTARHEALLRLIEQATGKGIGRQTGPDEMMGDLVEEEEMEETDLQPLAAGETYR